jgi:hypothetical protein
VNAAPVAAATGLRLLEFAQDIDDQAVAARHVVENGKVVGAGNFAKQRGEYLPRARLRIIGRLLPHQR